MIGIIQDVVAEFFAPDPVYLQQNCWASPEIGNYMPDVLANRIGGIVDREFLSDAADCTRSMPAGAAKRRVVPHGR